MKLEKINYSNSRWIRILSAAFCGWLVITVAWAGQGQPAALQTVVESQQKRDFTIRVNVDEVQIDAVVVDKKGRQITDLTAEDFEIYQDGKRQDVTSAIYINNHRDASGVISDSPALSRRAPQGSTHMLSADKAKQSMIFVIDDRSMNFQNVHYARMAVTKFVESQMQPTDMIAIMKTSSGTGALQMFSSDKRELLSIVNNLRWDVRNCGPGG
jgi:VWFA-related protein